MSLGIGRSTPFAQPSNYHTALNHRIRDEEPFDPQAQIKVKCKGCGCWIRKNTTCYLCRTPTSLHRRPSGNRSTHASLLQTQTTSTRPPTSIGASHASPIHAGAAASSYRSTSARRTPSVRPVTATGVSSKASERSHSSRNTSLLTNPPIGTSSVPFSGAHREESLQRNHHLDPRMRSATPTPTPTDVTLRFRNPSVNGRNREITLSAEREAISHPVGKYIRPGTLLSEALDPRGGGIRMRRSSYMAPSNAHTRSISGNVEPVGSGGGSIVDDLQHVNAARSTSCRSETPGLLNSSITNGGVRMRSTSTRSQRRDGMTSEEDFYATQRKLDANHAHNLIQANAKVKCSYCGIWVVRGAKCRLCRQPARLF